jgi:NADPH oxidase 2
MDLKRSDTMSTVSTKSERARWPPLTRILMSGEMSGEPPRDLTTMEKVDRWMVNEGYRRLTVFVFMMVHAMIFAFGFMNYDLKVRKAVSQ